MRIARNIILSLLALSLFWVLAGCQSDVSPQTTTSEPAFELKVDILGRTHTIFLDDEGRLIVSAALASSDAAVILSIDENTRLLNKDGKPLSSIWMKTEQEQLAPPEDAHIIGAVYSLEPKDATSDPPLELTLSYDLNELPQGVRESDVYIAPYDEDTGWGRYSYKRVDTEKNRVTTQIDRLTRYAVLAPIIPASPEPAPKPPSAPDLTSIPLQQALSSGKPTLAEFGWRTCVPCKEMKPVLEELAVEYEGKLNVVIIEVYEQEELTRQHGIMAIPTQIFFDSSGEEITRHMGFWPREEIITQLEKMGIE